MSDNDTMSNFSDISDISINEILKRVDHTNLSVSAGWEDIKALCEDAVRYGTASVCIPACYVAAAKRSFPQLCVCTVIGFPNGYSTTGAKCFEAAEAVSNGADEIDMVINVGKLKSGEYDYVLNEINAVKAACDGRLLKVIVETCLLTDGEKRDICAIVGRSEADFIKTSTGFSTGGATVGDVRLMRELVGEGKQVKAAGGISSIEDAAAMLKAGASRLGTSRIIKIVKENIK